jgi:hypothetical protein
MAKIALDLATPPDREKAVIQLMFGGEQIAEVNQESDALQVEIYARRDGHPWILDFDELTVALENARIRLAGSPTPGL